MRPGQTPSNLYTRHSGESQNGDCKVVAGCNCLNRDFQDFRIFRITVSILGILES